MPRLGGKLAMVACATACGTGVAGTAFALSQARGHDATGASARSAAAARAPGSTVVPGLAGFAPATIPGPLHLDPLVVHPRQVVIQGGHGPVTQTITGTGSNDNPWAGGVWSPSGSGGSAGSGGTSAPPPPPPPAGAGGGGGGGSTSTGSTSTGSTSTGSTSTGSTSTGSTSTGSTSTGSTRTGSTSTASSALPRNTSSPRITGNNVYGSLLTAHAGTWTGSPTDFAYTWLRCSGGGSCTTQASGPTYRTTKDDLGFTFIVVVTATNDAGSRNARSDQSDTVQT